MAKAKQSPHEQLSFLPQQDVAPIKSAPPPRDMSALLFPKYQAYLRSLPERWTDFLDCAAAVYKHKFPNQVMIYGQYPTAALVADEKTWNKVGRQLKFNQCPIISIAQKKSIIVEHRLYDVSQTQGTTVESMDFTLSDAQKSRLGNALSDQFLLQEIDLAAGLTLLSKGFLSAHPKTLEKETAALIVQSAAYILCKKLGLPCTNNFAHMPAIKGEKSIVEIGEIIQSISKNTLDSISKQIIKIRSVDNERNNHTGRDGVPSSGGESIFAQQRDNVPTRRIRNGNTDPRADFEDSVRRGQLSFGNLRQETETLHGGKPLHTPVGIDDGRLADEAASPTGRAVNRDENIHDGRDGKEESTPQNGQLFRGSTAPGVDTNAGRGIASSGAVPANLAVNFSQVQNENATDKFSPKMKFADNVNAITLLKEIENQDRTTTADEQKTLSRYVGWGGLSNAFDEFNISWASEYSTLKSLLTPQEYEQARASTLTAYYTDPAIIGAMYQGVVNLGVTENATLLEPSMGVGNFFATLPKALENIQLHGVELDDLTGRIAKRLYPNAEIQIKGYQDTTYPDNLFDVCIGNVPFGEFKVSDATHSLLIHDYFFAKSVDKVKSNGIVAFITSKGTLDKANPSFRKYLAGRAELIGAVRLPDTAFKAVAGTEVTTDIIFLRKREHEIVDEPNWVFTGLNEDNIAVNQYYIDNPQNLLGTIVEQSSRYGTSTALKPISGGDLYSILRTAIHDFAVGKAVEILSTPPPAAAAQEELPADPNVKNFTYTLVNDNLYYHENSTMTLYDGKHAARVKSLHDIRQSVREIISMQSDSYDESEFKNKLENLNLQYDSFVNVYGYINDKASKQAFFEDADYPLLLSIENVDSQGGITKSRLFSEATIKPKIAFVPTAYEDLITLSMSQLGEINTAFMAEQFNTSEQDVIDNLKGKIYLNPQKQTYETADQYLSGNVKAKLDYAREKSTEQAKRYSENVHALEQVQPTPLTADDIDMKLGSSFIDLKYYKQFIYECAETPIYLAQKDDVQSKDRIVLTYNTFTSQYTIYNKGVHSNIKTNSTYGTDRKPFYHIVEDTLNLKDVKVYDRTLVNDKEKSVLNVKETQVARQKQELIRHEFKDWMLRDPIRANDVIATYNDHFNVFRPQTFNGENLFFDGMSNEITLREHQKNAVARCLYSGTNVLLGHVVGSGKTYTMAAAAMELKRIGIARKPLFVDEAHSYKNCFVFTKMSNVAGVTTTNAQKSFDMLMKTKYIPKKNDGSGVIFATGTPLSTIAL